MKTFIRNALITTVAAAVSLSLAACSGIEASSPEAAPRKPVIVMTVQNAAQAQQRTFTATVHARVETDVGFRTSGKIVQRLVDVGDSVRAGQPIARLDAADYALGVDAALDQMHAATADSEQAASDEARMGRLVGDGTIAVADHERQKAKADAAAARLNQARRNLALARNRTGYATLVAPYAGVVTSLRMEVGQVVSEGQPVLSLARQGEREIVADLPEDIIQHVAQLRASATTWSGEHQPLQLKLREVSPMASSATGTFRVRYALADESDDFAQHLALGSTTRLLLERNGVAANVTLPASALIKSNGAPGVWIVDPKSGAVSLHAIQINAFNANTIQIGGLPNGSQVVTVGAQKLDATMRVIPVERRNDARADQSAASGNTI